MTPQELVRSGDLSATLSDLQNRVRGDPANPKLRTFLFQLLALGGEWDKALRQLNVAGSLDKGVLDMVHMYRSALECEALRAEVFAGRRSPIAFGDPEHWLALLIEALRLLGTGAAAQSQQLRDEAFELAPATSGTIDDQPFEWIADADPRLGPVLEAIVNGRYCWVPFHRVRQIAIEPPTDLRDVVWAPAHFTWSNGGETVGLIPTRYPGSEASEDPFIRLSRKTEWVEREDGLFTGLGQRMFATDAGEFPIMDTRKIRLNAAADGAPARPEG